MATLLQFSALFLAFLAFITHIFGLPANWLILIIIAGWAWINPGHDLDVTQITLLIAVALGAEIFEFALQIFGARKYGATRSGNWGAILGAIAGAILGASFFFGLGALPGSLLGAYVGCYGVERLSGRSASEAAEASKGALIGKFLGLSVKLGVGVYLLASLCKLF